MHCYYDYHIICDAWSIGILLGELKGFYDERIAGRRFQSPRLALQYGDFSVWEKERQTVLECCIPARALKQKLKDVPHHLDLPLDRPPSGAIEYKASYRQFEFDPTQTELLRGLLRQEGVTPYMLLLAVFQAVLYRYSKQRASLSVRLSQCAIGWSWRT